jgi:hypothetical protein
MTFGSSLGRGFRGRHASPIIGRMVAARIVAEQGARRAQELEADRARVEAEITASDALHEAEATK